MGFGSAEVTGLGGPALSSLTTLGVGGPCRRLVEVRELGGLVDLLTAGALTQEPVLVLGGGSNLVVADEGFPGTVARIGLLGRRAASVGEDVFVSVAAGEDWSAFVESCVAEGLAGIECLAGIPGLVGATPVQNVGAYGQEVSQVVASVSVWDRVERQLKEMAPAECRFGYRTSIFRKNDRYVVVEVTFRLKRSKYSQPLAYDEVARYLGLGTGERAPLSEVAEAVLQLRRAKGMVLDPRDPDTRSVGSFFTNPVLGHAEMARLAQVAPEVPTFPAEGGTKVPAAWLVEHAGFHRGYRKGKAAISCKHALAIVAFDGARTSEVLGLAREVRDAVKERFGVVLQPEPVFVGAEL
jgi:UDP-N-acetylmuramate dehydrogenase